MQEMISYLQLLLSFLKMVRNSDGQPGSFTVRFYGNALFLDDTNK